jgi:hypothetical protein
MRCTSEYIVQYSRKAMYIQKSQDLKHLHGVKVRIILYSILAQTSAAIGDAPIKSCQNCIKKETA